MTLLVGAYAERVGYARLIITYYNIISEYRALYIYRYTENIIMRKVRAHNDDIYICCIVIAAIVRRHYNRGDCCTRAQRGNSRDRAPRAIMF